MPEWLMIVILFIGSLLINLPIWVALGIATVGTLMVSGAIPLDFFTQVLYNSADSFPILAVPFFMLAGDIMLEGGISDRLVKLAQTMVGHRRGSLGIIMVLTSAVFAAISGSGPATVAAVGGILIPYMYAENYDRSYTCGLAAAAGALGPVIPPSIIFVVYGIAAQVSITDLFMAGFVPGIVMALALIIFNQINAKKHNFGLMQPKASRPERLKALRRAIWSLLMPVIILGGIYSGMCTPTEAAVLACVYGLVVGVFIHKQIKLKSLVPILARTARTTGMVLVLVGTATAFGRLLAHEQIPVLITDFIYSISQNKYVILLIINVFLFFVGMIMDPLASVVILAPLLLNVVKPLGVSPLHFGVIMTMNLVIGLCTPPVGGNLFVAVGIGGIKVETLMKWLYPMIGVLFIVLLIFTYIPALSLFLVGG